jgi:DNA polymerase III gamma/tau subunit
MQHPLTGHQANWAILKTLHKRKALPHGILLAGKRSIGKRKLALELAKLLLIEGLPESSSKTSQELQFNRGEHPDIHLVYPEEGKKQIKVEQIRNLKEAFSLNSYYGAGMVAIIDNAHQMNISAANTLLKTLEEPEKNKYIILITDCPQLVPDTIISRCHIFNCAVLSPEDVKSILVNLSEDPLEDETIQKISHFANDSLSLLGLEELVDQRNLKIMDQTMFKERLLTVASTLVALSKRIDDVLQLGKNSSSFNAQLIQLIQSLEKDPALPVFWDLLMEKTRVLAMQESKDKPALNNNHWSDKIIELSELKSSINQRNLVPSMQISRVLGS